MQDEVNYWKRLAETRGELVGCLMAGNRSRGAVLIQALGELEKQGPAGEDIQAKFRRQVLRDAVAQLNHAVEYYFSD